MASMQKSVLEPTKTGILTLKDSPILYAPGYATLKRAPMSTHSLKHLISSLPRKISFGVKLGLALLLLSTGITSTSVYYFYATTQNFIRRQTQEKLKKIGHTAILLLTEEFRQNLVQLKAEIDRESQLHPQVNPTDLQALQPGYTVNSLSPTAIQRYQSSPQFQQILQVLRKVQYASADQVGPAQEVYPQRVDLQSGDILPYIVVTTPESPDRRILKFLASSIPNPQGHWPGNPIGNLYVIPSPIYSHVFEGNIQVANHYVTDSFYTSMTAVIPIKDTQGRTIAGLGLDYIAGSEADELHKLGIICSSIILGSFVLSLGAAILIARWFGRPIAQLQAAVQDVRDRNYDVTIEVTSQDELGALATTFNAMVDEIRTYAKTLEKQNQELQRLDQLKNDFLANISHELRTPLNGMIGLGEVMLDDPTGRLSSEQNYNLKLLVQSGKRLANLVNDILDFSKLQHQELHLHLKPVSLREIVEIVLQLDRVLIGRKSLQLLNHISDDLPLVDADENRLQQIFHNLIGNAIKFTPQGTVKISATLVATPSPHLEITISDTGIGIPPDQLDRVFESFEQVNSSANRQYGGTGLGLAITHKLIELHGGKIWVESQLGKGTTFTLTLPVSQLDGQGAAAGLWPDSAVISANDGDYHMALLGDEAINSSPEFLQKTTVEVCPHILIVDDEPVNLQVFKNFLKLQNYTLTLTSSGHEALTLLENGLNPDIVLLDVMMPRMTGYEVIQVIRSRFSADRLPILLLSARHQPEDIVLGLEVGANDYLTKPINKDELLARIQTHLQIRQLEEEAVQLTIAHERELIQFLDALPVGVAVHKLNGNVLYFNQMAQQLLPFGIEDVDPQQLASTYHIYQAKTNALYPTERLPVFRALRGESFTADDMEIHRDGEMIPVEVRGTPVLNDQGEVVYAIVAFQDITERKRAEQILSDYSLELGLEVSRRTIELAQANRLLQEEIQERKQAEQALQRANQALQRLATVDGLTQVANRRCFDERLRQEWYRLAREQEPLALILFDVDYFKAYNDYYGHLAGDTCLVQIAQATMTAVNRPADLIARYGGEEFAAILPSTDQVGAIAISERIQQTIHALAIPHAQSEIAPIVTVSLGIASLIPSDHYLPAALVALADRALYAAKQQGRDRYAIQVPES